MMQAGEYYVGDLCYVMHDEFDEVCDLVYPQDDQPEFGQHVLKDGRRFAIYKTYIGDGEYYTTDGRAVSVDSGTIGCILKSDIRDDQYTEDELGRLAIFETYNRPFETYSFGKGKIAFGLVEIDTYVEW